MFNMAITYRPDQETKEKLIYLENVLKKNTNTAVITFCINKTYDLYKDMKK